MTLQPLLFIVFLLFFLLALPFFSFRCCIFLLALLFIERRIVYDPVKQPTFLFEFTEARHWLAYFISEGAAKPEYIAENYLKMRQKEEKR